MAAPMVKNRSKAASLAAKKSQAASRSAEQHLSAGIAIDSDDNGLTESWRFGRNIAAAR
jgi:hypothetical protein